MNRTFAAIGVVALLGMVALAGCGSSGNSSSSSTESNTSTASSESASSNGGSYGGGETSSASAGGGYGGASGASAGSGATTVAVVSVGKAGDLGKVIVSSKGMTLYDFHKDKGTTSACYGACEKAWPPLLTSGSPRAMGGAQGSMLGTTERKDGSLQVTYNGHPLYTFVEDKKPGEANGNDSSAFGAQWYALEPNGEEPEDDS